jgi:hypothetical protein
MLLEKKLFVANLPLVGNNNKQTREKSQVVMRRDSVASGK